MRKFVISIAYGFIIQLVIEVFGDDNDVSFYFEIF